MGGTGLEEILDHLASPLMEELRLLRSISPVSSMVEDHGEVSPTHSLSLQGTMSHSKQVVWVSWFPRPHKPREGDLTLGLEVQGQGTAASQYCTNNNNTKNGKDKIPPLYGHSVHDGLCNVIHKHCPTSLSHSQLNLGLLFQMNK